MQDTLTKPAPARPYYRAPDILSTGQVARMIGSCPRTVVKMMDAGLLRGYRLPTGTANGDRRFRMADLIVFCRKNQVPLPPGLGVVVCVGPQLVLSEWWDTVTVPDWVELAFRLGARPAVAWVIDYAGGRVEADRGCRLARERDETVPIARLLPEDVTPCALAGPVADFRRPFDPEAVGDWLAGELEVPGA